jgi:hypothetical protein
MYLADPTQSTVQILVCDNLIQIFRSRANITDSPEECCGSGIFIPDPHFSIPDPGLKMFESRIRVKELFLTLKIVSKLSEK